MVLLSGEGVNLSVEDSVLEGDSRLVDEEPQAVQAPRGPARVRVVAVEDRNRLALGDPTAISVPPAAVST